jgi:hypothetical protein
MLAWGTPEALLDATRLSDFSAKPKKSHGACSVHRIPPGRRLHGSVSGGFCSGSGHCRPATIGQLRPVER